MAVFAGRDLQLSADLRRQRTHDFHSKAFVRSEIESRRQARPVI